MTKTPSKFTLSQEITKKVGSLSEYFADKATKIPKPKIFDSFPKPPTDHNKRPFIHRNKQKMDKELKPDTTELILEIPHHSCQLHTFFDYSTPKPLTARQNDEPNQQKNPTNLPQPTDGLDKTVD